MLPMLQKSSQENQTSPSELKKWLNSYCHYHPPRAYRSKGIEKVQKEILRRVSNWPGKRMLLFFFLSPTRKGEKPSWWERGPPLLEIGSCISHSSVNICWGSGIPDHPSVPDGIEEEGFRESYWQGKRNRANWDWPTVPSFGKAKKMSFPWVREISLKRGELRLPRPTASKSRDYQPGAGIPLARLWSALHSGDIWSSHGRTRTCTSLRALQPREDYYNQQ